VYRLSEDLPAGADHGGELGIEELQVDRGAVVTVHLRLTDPTDEGAAVAYLRIGDTTWTQPLDPASRHGDAYDVTWTIAAPDAPAGGGPSTVHLPADADAGVLSVGLATGGDDGARWERRMAYRTTEGGAALEVLRPGQAWARAADGPWLLSNMRNPVEDLGG
jgi:hypothetical protein